MRWINRYTHWLEQHWAIPTYGGWVILGLTASFWLAAANTLAGWLYVLSGTCLALLLLAAWLPMRLLRGISVTRASLYPVSVGETLSLSVTLERRTPKGPLVLQCQDQLPASFETVPWKTLEWPVQEQYRWTYGVIPRQRGYYQWRHLTLRTGAPFGLFSCQRERLSPASVLVYPEVIALNQCPILDEFSADQGRLPEQQHARQLGQDGTTRSLRPYRHGDARRLIHWRSSAKFNELRTRELEAIAGDSPVIIALNSSDRWSPKAFESAIIAAASLFHYAQQQRIPVQLWTAGSGIQQQDIAVLETLALLTFNEAEQYNPPVTPVLWLTESPHSISSLPDGSRTILWHTDQDVASHSRHQVALVINSHQDLEAQLQQGTTKHS